MKSEDSDRILKTRNYSMFHLHESNREIKPDVLNNLRRRIETRNLLALFPIVVTHDMTVVDGQHRLKAAEILRVPIYYIFNDDITPMDAAFTNAGTTKWDLIDYVRHYAKQGKADYKELLYFMDSHPLMSLSAIVGYCRVMSGENGFGTNRVTPHRLLREGNFSADGLVLADLLYQAAEAFAEITGKQFIWTKPFLSALNTLMRTRHYNHEHMLNSLQRQAARLLPAARSIDYLRELEAIYNYMRRDKMKFNKTNRPSRKKTEENNNHESERSLTL